MRIVRNGQEQFQMKNALQWIEVKVKRTKTEINVDTRYSASPQLTLNNFRHRLSLRATTLCVDARQSVGLLAKDYSAQ
jgi:hypothetical protein